MKRIIFNILVATAVLVNYLPAFALDAVPQLSITESNGNFTHVELSDGLEISHSEGENDKTPIMSVKLQNENSFSISTSNIAEASVVRTSIPALSLNFNDYPNKEHVWLKEDYINATLKISGNGYCDDQAFLDVTLKGRGNSTWGMPKKPIRLKFSKKTSIAGFKKAKNYVLLANYIDNSHMRNTLAMWLANKIGIPYANHTTPCDLFINGKYVGLYLLTEKVGINGASVDIDETQGILFELSAEFDEPYKFRSPIYDLPVMVKDPDLEEISASLDGMQSPDELLQKWQSDFCKAEEVVKNSNASDAFDLKSVSDYFLVCEIMRNFESLHPKSVYIHKKNLNEDSKYYLGPLWDFDNSANIVKYYSGESAPEPFDLPTWKHPFFQDLTASEEYMALHKEAFYNFYENIWPEMLLFIEHYRDTIHTSMLLDGKRWPESSNIDDWASHIPSSDPDTIIADLTEWLSNRVIYLKEKVDNDEIPLM